MANILGIKPTWAGGEYAPELQARVDLKLYNSGAKTLRNFIVHPTGGISNRPGTHYIATAKETYGFDEYTKFISHFNGADGYTQFRDEIGNVITAVGTAQLDTAQKKFGVSSLLLDGDSDYITMPDSADWNFGAGDWSIEGWIRLGANTSFSVCDQQADGTHYWRIYMDATKLKFRYNDGTNAALVESDALTWNTNTWYHIEITRKDDTIYFFQDGVAAGSGAFTYTMADFASILRIGYTATGYYLKGHLDEFRISKGIARHIAGFTTESAEYQPVVLASSKIKLFPFEFSTQQTYIIEFGNKYCRFYTDGGAILDTSATAWVTATGYTNGDFVTSGGSTYYCEVTHTSGTFADDLADGDWYEQAVYEIPTPYETEDLDGLNFTQSADVLYLTHPDYAPRELSRTADATWSLDLYDYIGGPFQIQNIITDDYVKISAVSGNDKTLTATGFTFDEDHVGALWKLRHYIEGQAVTTALGSATQSTSILCNGTWRLITHGTWTGTLRIEKSTDGGSNWTMLREFSSADDFNPELFGVEDLAYNEDPFLVRLNMTAYTSGTCNSNLTSDPWYQDGIVKITAVTSGGATATADVKKTCGLTTDTIDWSEGSWSPYRGWPTVVEFHPEDRLVFANTYHEPQTYWMTRTGNYSDFSRSGDLLDSDGITSPLPSRRVNGINGLVAITEMLALTSSSEASIRSTSGPLSPTTVYNSMQGYEGSYGLRPLVIGNRIIYVQATGAIIRDLGFDIDSNSFVGNDLSIRSSHLFNDYYLTEMAYQQNPSRLVWCVRSDGILLSMTYLREQEVIAWTWHDTGESALGGDKFESVATIRGDGYDEVWVAVERGNSRFIERFDERMNSTDTDDQFFVDSGLTYDGDPATVITGLDHLDGREVIVLADGLVVTGHTVASGQITLATAASKVQVGLQYYADLKTLDIEIDLEDGTAQGRKLKVSRVMFKVLNSLGGNIGADEDSLYVMSKPYSDQTDLYTGIVKETLGGGYRDGGEIFFRQSDPLPITILSIVPSIQTGGITQS